MLMIKINEFNYDLERMKKAVDAKSYKVPDTLKNLDDFDEWLENIKPQDDFEHLEANDN